MSEVEVTSRDVKIRKNYFWGVIGMKWVLNFNQITCLRSKEYEVETYEDLWILTENVFTFFIGFFKPKVKWRMTVLYYLEDGIEKDIELKMNTDDYREIDRKIRHRDYSI